jgi:hypothetical protein
VAETVLPLWATFSIFPKHFFWKATSSDLAGANLKADIFQSPKLLYFIPLNELSAADEVDPVSHNVPDLAPNDIPQRCMIDLVRRSIIHAHDIAELFLDQNCLDAAMSIIAEMGSDDGGGQPISLASRKQITATSNELPLAARAGVNLQTEELRNG